MYYARIIIMKQKIIQFFKNKLNITLLALQFLAIICALLGFFIFFLFEGAFFVIWGIKLILAKRYKNNELEIYEQLPYSEEQKKNFRKNIERTNKSNRIMGFMLIAMGIILFFYLFSSIF